MQTNKRTQSDLMNEQRPAKKRCSDSLYVYRPDRGFAKSTVSFVVSAETPKQALDKVRRIVYAHVQRDLDGSVLFYREKVDALLATAFSPEFCLKRFSELKLLVESNNPPSEDELRMYFDKWVEDERTRLTENLVELKRKKVYLEGLDLPPIEERIQNLTHHDEDRCLRWFNKEFASSCHEFDHFFTDENFYSLTPFQHDSVLMFCS